MLKRILIFIFVSFLIALLAFFLFRFFVEKNTVPSEIDESMVGIKKVSSNLSSSEKGPLSTAVQLERVEVIEVIGEVIRTDVGGRETALVTGEHLTVDDSVLTDVKSSAKLRVGTRSTIELAERSKVKVKELSESVQRLGLLNGRASVDYNEDGNRVLKIENEDGSTVAQVSNGRFSILNTKSTVAVATQTGIVDLTSGGETVAIEAGKQSVVHENANKAIPARPSAIPAKLVLRVVDPGCRIQREPYIDISGKTAKGSRVRINDIPARVNSRGRFSARVPLHVGKNRIVVVTQDVLGREQRRVFPCVTVDPNAAIKKINIEWGSN